MVAFFLIPDCIHRLIHTSLAYCFQAQYPSSCPIETVLSNRYLPPQFTDQMVDVPRPFPLFKVIPSHISTKNHIIFHVDGNWPVSFYPSCNQCGRYSLKLRNVKAQEQATVRGVQCRLLARPRTLLGFPLPLSSESELEEKSYKLVWIFIILFSFSGHLLLRLLFLCFRSRQRLFVSCRVVPFVRVSIYAVWSVQSQSVGFRPLLSI